jgi:hypothetical protein
MRNASIRIDPKHRVDPLTSLAALETQYLPITRIGTRFAKGATVVGKIECRYAVLIQNDNLLFTGSDAGFGSTRNALTLKKRFIQAVRRTHHEG